MKPLMVKLESIVNNEKFRSCSENDIENLLRDKILGNTSEIPYYFSISCLHPSVFTLFYLINSNPYHEYMDLTPHGLRFRKDKFSNLDELISYFLKHPEMGRSKRWGSSIGFGGNNDSTPQEDSWGWGGSTTVNDASAGYILRDV